MRAACDRQDLKRLQSGTAPTLARALDGALVDVAEPRVVQRAQHLRLGQPPGAALVEVLERRLDVERYQVAFERKGLKCMRDLSGLYLG